MKIDLTKSQCESLIDFIESNLLDVIRKDTDIDSLECSEDALEFHVQGFLHTGNVRVIYIEGIDLFQVCLYDEEGNLVEQIESVHFDELAEVIDLKVENDMVGDYKAKVMKFLMYS